MYLPEYGTVRLVVATNGQGGLDYIVSNDQHRRGKSLLHRKRSWVSQAMERQVALVLLAFVVLQQLRLVPSETVGEVKRRWHLTVIRGDQPTSGAAIAPPKEGKIMAAA